MAFYIALLVALAILWLVGVIAKRVPASHRMNLPLRRITLARGHPLPSHHTGKTGDVLVECRSLKGH